MAAAIVEVCVDPRLNHELLRIQVRTGNNHLRWSDEPARRYEPFGFGGY